MITFRTISSVSDILTQKIYRSYCETFPVDERRNETQFFQLFDSSKSKIISINQHSNTVGYLIIWEFDEFMFLEHFEIFEEFRNQKLGSHVLSNLSKIYPKILLESEPADLDEIASKRIAFYNRNGFETIDKNYIQPAYDNTKKDINLWLLSNFDNEKTSDFIKLIHQYVYQKS